MNYKNEYITGIYYQYMGKRRQILADIDNCLSNPNTSGESTSSQVEGYLLELDRVSSLITTLQREFPDIIRISQAPTPAE